MMTTREVLMLAEGSQLADLVAGDVSSRAGGQDGTLFLDMDPTIFAKILSILRLRRFSMPDSPTPRPYIHPDLRPDFDRIVRELGLFSFIYGDAGYIPEQVAERGDIFEIIAEQAGVRQGSLQSEGLVDISLSTSRGLPPCFFEEAISIRGMYGAALESDDRSFEHFLRIRFHKHKVIVEGMELRTKMSEAYRMSDRWTFVQGRNRAEMGFSFTMFDTSTGNLCVPGNDVPEYVDEIEWLFPKGFCIEQIRLYGRVIPNL